MNILFQLDLGCDMRFCISNRLLGDTDTAGPWTTLIEVRDQ